MDLLTFARVVARRWYVVLAVGILTIGSAIVVMLTAEAEYEAHAAVMLEGPSAASGDATDLNQLVDPGVIAEVAQGSSVRAGLNTDVPYTVDVGSDGEILRVTARDVSPDGLVETVEAVMDAIAAEVQNRQHNAGVPADDRVLTEVLRMPDQPIAASDGSEFTASGSVLLVPPHGSASQPFPPNSYTLSVLQTWLSSEEALRAISDRGGQAAYTTAFDSRGAAPMMMVSVTGTADQDPIATMNLVIDVMRDELASRQQEEGVPEAFHTTVEEIAVPTVADEASTGLLRPLVVVVGLGVIAALSLTFVTEGAAQALARRREQTEAELRREVLAKAVQGRDQGSGDEDHTRSNGNRRRRADGRGNRAPSVEPLQPTTPTEQDPVYSEASREQPRSRTPTSTTPAHGRGASTRGSAQAPPPARNGSVPDAVPTHDTRKATETGGGKDDVPHDLGGHEFVASEAVSGDNAETVELRIPEEIDQYWSRHR